MSNTAPASKAKKLPVSLGENTPTFWVTVGAAGIPALWLVLGATLAAGDLGGGGAYRAGGRRWSCCGTSGG